MNEETVRAKFHERIQADAEEGSLQPLEFYQGLFPAHADLITREYEKVSWDSREAPSIEPLRHAPAHPPSAEEDAPPWSRSDAPVRLLPSRLTPSRLTCSPPIGYG